MDDHPGLVVLVMILLLPVALVVGAAFLVGWLVRNAWRDWEQSSERSRRLQAAAAPPVERGTPEHRVLGLSASGREVFTPEALLVGRVYRVIVTGTYSYLDKEGATRRADALHKQDGHGNFAQPHDEVVFRHQQLGQVPHLLDAADRDAHRYSFLVDGRGEKLSIGFPSLGADPLGTLRVDVVLLNPAEPTVARRREEEAHHAAIAKIKQEVARLRVVSEIDRNWGEPGFLADVSKSRAASLLRDQERIRRDFIALHEKNPQLATYMREHEPDLYARLTGPLEAFLAAECRDAKPQRAAVAPPAKPTRPKITVDEYRERLVRRLTVATEDQKAVVQAALKRREEHAALLRNAGMDEDEIEQALGSKTQALQEVLGQFSEQKGGSHVAPQELA